MEHKLEVSRAVAVTYMFFKRRYWVFFHLKLFASNKLREKPFLTQLITSNSLKCIDSAFLIKS